MTKIEHMIIKNSFSQVLPISEAAAKLFYLKLFELDPKLKKLFSTDLDEQGTKLICLIENAIHFFDNHELLIPTLKALGARHVNYNVKPADYDTAQQAMIWMLEQVLDKDFTPRVQNAWETFFIFLSETMKSGAIKAA